VFHQYQSLVLSFSYSTVFLSVILSLIRFSAIIYSSLGHHLFTDDAQLFISFRTLEFSANILHLQNTIVSQWMSANQSKTEFLIGLPAQLSQISDPSLLMPSNVTITPAKSARNLGVIFASTLSMSDHISPVSKSGFLIYSRSSKDKNTFDFSTARTIATSLIHFKLSDYSKYYNS